MQNIRNFNLLQLVPPSLQSDPQIVAACSALENELQAVSVAIDQIMIISKLDQQPSEVIDNLAWQWHVDFYDDTLPLETKIALVKNSIPWHRIKGTPAAVEQVVSAAIVPIKVLEWFDYGGQPYHFMVQADGIMSSKAVYDQMRTAINTVKNVRSWLDGIQLQRTSTNNIYLGFLTGQGGIRKIGLRYPKKASNNLFWGGAAVTSGTKKINISLPRKAPVSVFTGAFIVRSGVITIGGIH